MQGANSRHDDSKNCEARERMTNKGLLEDEKAAGDTYDM